MPETYATCYYSPVGPIHITGTEKYISEVSFAGNHTNEMQEPGFIPELPAVLQQCVEELMEYFQGVRRNFDIPVSQEGTGFQKKVWNELLAVPYGKTISYLELSKRVGDVKAIRAVAATNGKNKIAVIVPCHRIIGSNNDLVGYAGGLAIKKWLLDHEKKITYGIQTLF